ncbi:hypothetical protein I6N98_04500 [Spongiibacter nanhainus]|uniref:Uncharacterized protein n=1 Tax=Spongiibacter nanhainus TaxID=2794344 RepID=A0A7T4R289_9GAMM|nr:DUF6482 family protein [Spongiibacter nanhainus]QQD19121.1 hypothetical protein I6N98_04500 [Spongiibacter nanhainus]
MPGIRLADLAKEAVREVHIHAHEGGLYTLSAEGEWGSRSIYSDDGKPLCSRQLIALRKLLTSKGCIEQYLLHKSPYDEMMGLPPSSAEAMKIRLEPIEEESL